MVIKTIYEKVLIPLLILLDCGKFKMPQISKNEMLRDFTQMLSWTTETVIDQNDYATVIIGKNAIVINTYHRTTKFRDCLEIDGDITIDYENGVIWFINNDYKAISVDLNQISLIAYDLNSNLSMTSDVRLKPN